MTRVEMDSKLGADSQLDYGCGSLLLTAIIMIGLITFNSFVVNHFVDTMQSTYDGFSQMPRLQRAIQIVAPVVLLVFQYWVWDFFRDRLFHRDEPGQRTSS